MSSTRLWLVLAALAVCFWGCDDAVRDLLPPASGVAAGEGEGEGEPQTCERYCELMAQNCGDVFVDNDVCVANCGLYPDGGMAGDTDGNTLQCRIYHAGVAAENGELHCPHAGPEGGDICGSYCDVYCDAMDARCGDEYADRDQCMAACGAIDAEGDVGAVDGNSIQCRIYHAGLPAADEPATHCGHAGADGGGVCGSWCDLYCDLTEANCDGLYGDRADCLATCGLFPDDGERGATEGNSVQCRAYHAGVAAENGELHCPHASANGGAMCGDYCENYCHLAMQTCDGLYEDADACLAECAAFPVGEEHDAVVGDSVQCRTYHASFPALVNGELHCPHASPSGGAQCGSWCDVYCNRVGENCGDLYVDRDACMDWCAVQPDGGDPGDVVGDSIQCRIYHANLPAAESEEAAAMHCPHASPSGGNQCGSWCEVYCERTLDEAGCDEDNQMWGGREDMRWGNCMAACEAYPADAAHDVTDGNSVQCRIYHAGVAQKDDAPAMHCPHASSNGGGVCGTPCEGYCNQMGAHCEGGFNDDRASCEAACGAVEATLDGPGEWNAVIGNSVACRTYHASFPAANGPGQHCPHASLGGGGVCSPEGGDCATYCDLMGANCPDVYGDEGTCVLACLDFNEGVEAWGDAGGDTLQCRIYHASGPAAGAPEDHCPHAAPDGGGVCVEPEEPTPCDAYCDLMADNCGGVYPDRDACMATCALFPEGGEPNEDGDVVAGNSVECRTYHAGVAVENGELHCPHASANGGGTCGEYCENYCHVIGQTCTGDDEAYADNDACMAACAAMPDDGATDAIDGNSVQCRTYHATFPAALLGAGDHCPHASVNGGGVCGDYCEAYCDQAMANCGGDQIIYPNRDDCVAACGAMPSDGDWNATGGNSVQCRTYHASSPAAGAPADHCPHAGIASDAGVCGTPCEAFCDQAMANCAGDDALYMERAGCELDCVEIPADGPWNATAGDSLQCRAYHASFPAAGTPAMHCLHAGGAAPCAVD